MAAVLTPVVCGDAAIDVLSVGGAALVLCQGQTPDEWAASIVKLMQPIAMQIRVFGNRPDWRTVGVNTEKEADRSEGTGESPLHMDFVNAEFPPDFVVLLCVRTDPLGGGQSTLSPLAEALDCISQNERRLMEARQFIDGRVEGLMNVGRDINPFPILSNTDSYRFRYTSQLLKGNYSNDTLAAIQRFHTELEYKKIKLLIPSGHALIVNQHFYVHGKLKLGEAQEKLPKAQRRMLLHGFFRYISQV